MNLITGCACGLDPATEGLAIQSLMAAGIAAPFVFRERLAAAWRRVRGRSADPDCETTPDDSGVDRER